MGNFLWNFAMLSLFMGVLILLVRFFSLTVGRKIHARTRYLLWILILLRMCVPVLLPLPTMVEIQVEDVERYQIIERTTQPDGSTDTAIIPYSEYRTRREQGVYGEGETVNAKLADNTLQISRIDLVEILPVVWLTGAVLYLFWNLGGYHLVMFRFRRTFVPAPASLNEQARILGTVRGMKRIPAVYTSDTVRSPMLCGFLRPVIVVPRMELTENEAAGVLAHELTHYRRGDLWIQLFGLLVCTMHWFNPAVHLADRWMREEMELSCDEAVLAGQGEDVRSVYGNVMLSILRQCRKKAVPMTTHFSPRKRMMQARFENIMDTRQKKRGVLWIAVILVLCLIAGAIVAYRTEETDMQEDTISDSMRMSYLDTHLDYPARWYNKKIGLLGTAGGENLTGADFMFWLDEYRAYTESGNGRVWTLEAVLLTDFEKTAEHFLTTEGVDVYTTGYGNNHILIGTDSKHAWVLVLPTDVQFLENDPISRENYELLQKESQKVLENFMKQNEIIPNPTCPASEVYIQQNTASIVPVDTDTIWQTFLDTVISPYSDYIIATEYLDLDGNGIDELIIYNWGASANCGIEIFTIENGEVRSFSTGTSVITHYSGEAKSLAPLSANAVDFSFWGLPTSYADKSDVVLWFTPCTNRNGHVLYSMNGSDVHTSEDYYYFTSDKNGNLTVELLRSFLCEAIDSSPANGWKCYINGEKVNVREFRDNMDFFWQDLSVTHGVQYHDKNTASRYDELETWMEDHSEEIIMPEAEMPEGIVDENSEPYTYTREEWIRYSLYTDFGFREPVDVSALTDDELTTYMADAYQCALDIYFLFDVCSDRMYARNIWSSTMPHVEIAGRHYSQMFNPVFPTLADLESYMNGVLSPDLTKQLLSSEMFIDYEGELWGMMGARGTNISMKTIGFSITSRTDTEIIYTAEVEVREYDLASEEPDYVEYHDFTYALTEDGWRWTDFYLYN